VLCTIWEHVVLKKYDNIYIYIYSATWWNRTLSKLEYCPFRSKFQVPSFFLNNLC
jgi:hypothetical protein